MTVWSSTQIAAVKLPSGAWVRIDRVDAVTLGVCGIDVHLSSGGRIKASETRTIEESARITKIIWNGRGEDGSN